ncbi:MAG: histidine kinase [Cyclobacteriaceae bacterium]|nr:histidine kinase [Cyclobacteriaceae bacterium HetDA_MAG_MS6]
MNKRKLYWICQLGGWSVYGILQVILYTIAQGLDLRQIVGEFFQVGFYILSSHFFRTSIIKFGWLAYKWPKLIPRIIAGTVVLSLFNYVFLLLISFIIGSINFQKDFTLMAILINVSLSAFVYILWSLLYLIFHYFERYNKSLKYDAAIREIELNNLKAQLNPHFMFNALNSIRALVDENPSKSKEAITQLSSILRNSLMLDRKKLVSLPEEIATVKDYLALESIRYEERLKTIFDLDSESDSYYIPPLMIQTLVENGIKHGIANLKNGGQISVTTQKVAEGLRIQIRNSGKFHNGKSTGIGYGLLNTRKRLELVYGDSATFKIVNEENETVLTEIIIPEFYDSTSN